MEKRFMKILMVVFIVVLLAGSFQTAAAAPLSSGEGECRKDLNGEWDPRTQICYWRISPIYGYAVCYPLWDIAGWRFGGWWFDGCTDRGAFTQPGSGSHALPGGMIFENEPGLCAGRCKISRHTLVGAASNALGDLPAGRILGKTYIRIVDEDGLPTTGQFTLCMNAKGAKNPAYFKFVNGVWAYLGGYWRNNRFCMGGFTGGNFVLVNVR